MIFTTHTTISATDFTLIPLLKTDDTATHLTQIAQRYALDAETLVKDFKAEAKEVLFSYSNSLSKKVVLLGLGKESSTSQDWINAFRSVVFAQKGKMATHITINLNFVKDTAKATDTAIIGALQGTYQIGLHKSETPTAHPLQNVVLLSETPISEESIKKSVATAETQLRIMTLVNSAPNVKLPVFLADWAVASGKKNGFSVTIFDKKECIANGLKALLSVNDGSPHEPRFILMEYKGLGENLPKIGLVGKGVTFDTGGISIKPSSNMHFMKSDMGGAAAVLGTMELCAKLKLPIHLIAAVPTTENMVDGEATKPGAVIGSYLGKTIEVIDTDAEGRLILADGLSYLKKNYNPDILIDIATLTGSAVQTFGYHAGAAFSNSMPLITDLYTAANATGERIWQLPIWDNYAEDIKSDVADVANFSGKPIAGAISAAKFLEVFTDNHPNWCHIDMAGVALATNELGSQRVATAWGVRLLTEFIAVTAGKASNL